MKVDLSVFLSTSRETKWAVWLECNCARFTLEVLFKVALCISCIPLNDTRANGLLKQQLKRVVVRIFGGSLFCKSHQ